MIHSIFILNGNGQVIIEKHYRGNTSRTESASFWSQTAKNAKGTPTDVPPFLPTPKGALVHLHRNGLFLLASVLSDTQPLFVTQFLSSLADIFEDYFGELNEHAIKDNFITVYELLDEMLDNGLPFTIEPNTLKELIAPPSMLNRVIDSLVSDQQKRLTSAASTIPWRRADVKHAQNEIFVDIIETIDATFSSTRRNMSHQLVNGVVMVNSRLSGTPDVTMTLRTSSRMDDVALHHCVRVDRYASSGTLSFIPPDGPFRLMGYTIRDAKAPLPVDVQTRFHFDKGSTTGSVNVTVVPRFSPPAPPPPQSTASAAGSMVLAHVMNATGKKSFSIGEPEALMEEVSVRIPLGPRFTGAALSANIGSVQFDSSTGVCTWTIGVVPRGKTPSLNGSLTASDEGGDVVCKPQVLMSFRLPGFSVSGVTVDSLELGAGERYKYYKGLRCITKAGVYEVRT